MSVFSDFQRMWVQRFPQSSLSDAWEQDVRASLQRHKQKIADLTKEIEQETLYVEYLERLLSDVEKYRESGGDPSAVFDAANPTSSTAISAAAAAAAAANAVTSTATLTAASASGATTENNADNVKEIIGSDASNDTNGLTASATGNNSTRDETKTIEFNKDGALHQCITELSSNLKKAANNSDVTSVSTSNINSTNSNNKKSSNNTGNNNTNTGTSTTTVSGSGNEISKNESSTLEIDKKVKQQSDDTVVTTQTTPSHFVTVIEVKESSTTSSPSNTEMISARSGNDNQKTNEKHDNQKDKMTQDTVADVGVGVGVKEKSSSQILAAVLEAKKKVPPRPPPKFLRRAAPVDPPTVPPGATTSASSKDHATESTSNSLERNIKPSEILRQKSSDSLDVKLAAIHRKTTPEIGMYSMVASDIASGGTGLAEEFGKKVAKAESLEKTKRPEIVKRAHSPTGSIGKNSPTGSLNKFGTSRSTDSPTDSLGKASNRATESAGSKESLASQGAPISERIKSYESISSLSSDSIKAAHGTMESEPYYDTVPMDNGDGDYVYIQAGGTGSTSSRDDISNAGSTLPMPAAYPKSYNSQTSICTEPESPGRNSNYVNIDYFLSQSQDARSSSIDSDGEMEAPNLMRGISQEDNPPTPGALRKLSGDGNRSTLIRHIITSIINSETLYVECLNKMMQYMKAIRATLTTSQPVISEEEFQTMFFKIDELYTVHTKFLSSLKSKVSQEGDISVGEIFKELAGHINLYGAFLHNYGRAIDTVKKCGSNNQQFKEIVSNIVVNSTNEQSLSLEDLLHKPVARVQKNALVLQDLINGTPQNHPDFQPLRQAQKMIRNFLSGFNVVQTKSFPTEDKALRRLVKNSFIVELADGHRKLRHLFLFNDVIVCAKYKPGVRDEFELKWFIPLKDICVLEESSPDPKENSPVNILHLKSQACTVRDQIMLEERDEKKQKSYGSRAGDKHRKKLHDLEVQLVLASPNLVFRISNKSTGKIMNFFLSSDFERTQWIECIMQLQQSCNLPGQQPISIYDLQAWIAACQTLIKTEIRSYLMRNNRDESLFVGDLYFTIQGLTGIEQPGDFFICVEVDFYGHYFRKAKTKLICRSSSPLWNESFILELEGSQNVRILLYEDHSPRQILRAKHVIKLSRSWLQESYVNMPLKLSDRITLNTTIRFVPGEVSLRRVPTSKPGALFGAKMQQVLKREKRDIPFIISACIREVERRGMCEVGIYRVSGSASDLAKLKKSFETNNYEAEQLLKEVDIHSVTGILKSYLRELPEALFTDLLYPKLFDVFNRYSNFNETARTEALQQIFTELPQANKASINFILDHLIRVHQQEAENKMSLHNLAMVFGPTLLRPAPQSVKQKDLLESSTVDVMAQAGILYSFLLAKIK